MNKALCVAVPLVTALAFMSGSKSVGSAPPSLTAPVVVASGKLLNQTEPFSATIYTTGVSGVYRLSTYATIVTADPNSTSSWWYNFGWTDASGGTQTTSNAEFGYSNVAGEFNTGDEGNSIGGLTSTFQANKGTPITHNTIRDGAPDNSVYSVFYVLERIE